MAAIRSELVLGLALLVGACSPPPEAEEGELVRRAEALADHGALQADLEAIAVWLQRELPEAAARLRPGLDDASIDATLAASGFDFALPEELRALYRWRDGMDPEGELPFVWYHRLLPLEEALARAGGGSAWFGLPENALPVFEFPEELYYVLCNPTPTEALPVRHRLLEDPSSTLAFSSLRSMLRVARAWYERGAARADGEGWLVQDEAELAAIHEELDPDAHFPYAGG